MLTSNQQPGGTARCCRASVTLLGLLACAAGADDLQPKSPEGGTQPGRNSEEIQASPAPLPAYRPKFPDAAPSRVGSVTRGSGVGAQDVMVLAPDRKGASATDQPTLFWYLPGNAERPVEVVIQERNADAPLLEIEHKADPARQIGVFAVADHGVRLRPGIEYEWSVALVTDPEHRSHDVFSMGTIQYVPPEPSLGARLQAASAAERVALLLDTGYWYDALQLLQSGAEAGDSVMTGWQSRLLQQEGLLAASRSLARAGE